MDSKAQLVQAKGQEEQKDKDAPLHLVPGGNKCSTSRIGPSMISSTLSSAFQWKSHTKACHLAIGGVSL